jgi:hypothetical protein
MATSTQGVRAMPARASLLLQPNRPQRLDAVRDAVLRVESGIVWITAGDAADDLFLAAGESYRVPRGGRVLVEAVRGEAAVHLARAERRPISVLVESCRALLPKGIAMP